MMRACAGLMALALISCSPADPPAKAEIPPPVPASVAQAGCRATTSHDWSAVGSQYYVVEAELGGANCADATATIRIKTTTGDVLFEHAYPVTQVPLAFSPNGDQSARRDELEEWAQNAADTPTANSLPAWPSGASRPPNFRPVVNRATYEGARGTEGPIFCFPDGGESNACVFMNGPHATLLGSLTPESE